MRIRDFLVPYSHFVRWAEETRPAVQSRVEALYRSCQVFASSEIETLTAELNFDFHSLRRTGSGKDS